MHAAILDGETPSSGFVGERAAARRAASAAPPSCLRLALHVRDSSYAPAAPVEALVQQVHRAALPFVRVALLYAGHDASAVPPVGLNRRQHVPAA